MSELEERLALCNRIERRIVDRLLDRLEAMRDRGGVAALSSNGWPVDTAHWLIDAALVTTAELLAVEERAAVERLADAAVNDAPPRRGTLTADARARLDAVVASYSPVPDDDAEPYELYHIEFGGEAGGA